MTYDLHVGWMALWNFQSGSVNSGQFYGYFIARSYIFKYQFFFILLES